MSSRAFNQDVGEAKRAARIAPVVVTDRGKPTHVLLSIEAFRRLSGEQRTIVDLLAVPEDEDQGAVVDRGGGGDPWTASR